jgi:hypothetical protein
MRATSPPGSCTLQIGVDVRKGYLAHGDEATLSPFAEHVDESAALVEIARLQRAQLAHA